MKRVIILNGPPNVGKDTIARELTEDNTIGLQFEFKHRLNEICASIVGCSINHWIKHYCDRSNKEKPFYELGGLTPRQLQIKVSEDWIKPVFGKDYFGKAVIQYFAINGREYDLYVSSDGGFPEETTPLIEAYGSTNIFVAQLDREGCDFSGDSRSYLQMPMLATKRFHNDKTPREVADEIRTWVVNVENSRYA